MSASTPEPLSLEQAAHVAKLARLRLDKDQLPAACSQLTTILTHLAKIAELDLANVEQLAHPSDMTNRLDDDEVAPSMQIDGLLGNAPATFDRFLTVPKVLDGGET